VGLLPARGDASIDGNVEDVESGVLAENLILDFALLRDDPELLALSAEWAVRAAHGAGHPEAFRDLGLGVTDQVTGRVPPVHRITGVHAAQALISHSLSDIAYRQRALGAFVRQSQQPSEGARPGTLLSAR
jgi:hypothetical protein